MSLRNRRFERQIRKVARAKLSQSESFCAEYRRSRSRFRVETIVHYAGLLVLLGWAFAVVARNDREYAAFGIAVYGIGSIIVRRQQLGMLMEGLNSNYFYLHHPVPDRTIFREHMRAMLRPTAWSVVVFATGLFFLFRSPAAWPLIAGLAVVMGLASFGGLLILIGFFPRLPGIAGLVVFVIYGAVLLGSPFLRDLIPSIQRALMLTPVGSLVFFVSEFVFHGNFLPLSLLPAAATLALAPWLYRQISASYSSAALLEVLARAQESGEDDDGESQAPAESLPAVMAERLVHEKLERGDSSVQPTRPWLDEFIHRQLSARERIVCLLLCGSEQTYWTQWWIRGCKLALIPVALMFVAGYVPEWLALFPAVIALLVGIPLFGGTWSGFADVWSSGKLAPFYATFPVSFRDIAGVILKVDVIRVLAWTPGILLVFVSAGKALETSPLTAAAFGLQFLFIAICIQPLMIITKFSNGSTDSKTWRLPAVVVFVSAFSLSFASWILGCLSLR